MLKWMYYLVVVALITSITWGIHWITTSEQTLLNSDTQSTNPLSNDVILVATQTDITDSAHLEKSNQSTALNKNNSNPHLNENTSQIQQNQNDHIELMPDDIQKQEELDQSKQRNELNEDAQWSNDPYLEEMVLRHLKEGISQQELDILFERRFEKDISNALVVLWTIEYFYPGEKIDARYQHLANNELSEEVLLRKFPNTRIGSFNLNRIAQQSNQIYKHGYVLDTQFYAFWLSKVHEYYKTMIPYFPKSTLKQLVNETKHSANLRINNIAQTYLRYLESNEALIRWIIEGNDQYGSFVYCDCLIDSALAMSLSQEQWLKLLSYYNEALPEYVFQVVQRLNNESLNLDLYAIWQELIQSNPELSKFDPLKQNYNDPVIASEFNDSTALIIQSLWNDFFNGSYGYEKWVQTQIERETSDNIEFIVSSLTWNELLTLPELVFDTSKVSTYFNKLSQLERIFSEKNVQINLLNPDFSFVTKINAFYTQIYQQGSFDAEQIKIQNDEFIKHIPISVRLNELSLEVILLLFSKENEIVDSESLFSMGANVYAKWPSETQKIYTFLEFIYHFRSEPLLWKDPTQKIIDANMKNELFSVLNTMCVLDQYHKAIAEKDRVEQFTLCQNQIVNHFYNAYSLEKDVFYEKLLNDNERVLKQIDMNALFEIWDSQGFTLDWISQLSV